MERMRSAHEDALASRGVGRFYGSQSEFARLSLGEQQQWLSKRWSASGPQAPPVKLDCLTFSMGVLAEAYRATGRADRWRDIQGAVLREGGRGTTLARELQKDGWTAVYWNPDARRPRDGSAEHTATSRMVARGERYYGIGVDARAENFAPSPGSPTQQDERANALLKSAPFYFGIARGGAHTFVGGGGSVVELHWDRMPDDPHVIEKRPFSEFPWLSGVILVPPGTLASGGSR